jgi:hypothetical protein
VKQVMFILGLFLAVQSFADSKSLQLALQQCLKQNGSTNPGTINCNTDIQTKADAEIAQKVAAIKSRLTGVDGHDRDISKYRPMVDQEIAAFQSFRDKASNVSGVLEGGTGSDEQAASTTDTVALTLQELRRLEALLN